MRLSNFKCFFDNRWVDLPNNEAFPRALIPFLQSEPLHHFLWKSSAESPVQILVNRERAPLSSSHVLSLEQLPVISIKVAELVKMTASFFGIPNLERVSFTFKPPSPSPDFLFSLLEMEKGPLAEIVFSYLCPVDLAHLSQMNRKMRGFLTPERILAIFSERFSKITKLSFSQLREYQLLLRRKDMATILHFFQNLRELDLSRSNVTDTQLAAIVGACPQLRTIRLVSCHGITDEGLKFLTDFTTIDLSFNPQILGSGFISLKKCETLFLCGCDGLINTNFVYLESCTTLNLWSCGQLLDIGLALLGNCRKVDLSYCHWVTGVGLSSLRNCITLNLTGCSHLKNRDLIPLSHCVEVNLSYCQRITNFGLLYLTNCRTLHLRGCPQVTERMKEILRAQGVVVND